MSGFSYKLYRLMENEYKKHGASNNGAQLIMRGNHLDCMVAKYGEAAVEDMLINDFDRYHFDKAK